MKDLNFLPLLARGGQADVYELGGDRILRVPRQPQQYDRIRYEYRVYRSLAGYDVPIPRVYELTEVRGAPSIVMQRIPGNSMLGRVTRFPPSLVSRAKEFTDLHLRVLAVDAPSSITDQKVRVHRCVTNSELLTGAEKRHVLNILETLPDGKALCHGDFHPGNILYDEENALIVDWSAASSGDPVSDIAHSYVLFKVVPRAPDVSAGLHLLQRTFGRLFLRFYIKCIRDSVVLDPGCFSKWVLVKAAERTFAGLSSELGTLQDFVRKSLHLLDAGIGPEQLLRIF